MKDKEETQTGSESMESRIRRERKFSLAEAVGREAAGSLSGASPVARAEQVLLEIDHLLQNLLPDPDGSLILTILAKLEHNLPLLGRHFENPVGALEEFLTETLKAEPLLPALVRDTDARWGRDYQERPHFERDGQPPHPEDPYTRAGVRSLLEDLQDDITAD